MRFSTEVNFIGPDLNRVVFIYRQHCEILLFCICVRNDDNEASIRLKNIHIIIRMHKAKERIFFVYETRRKWRNWEEKKEKLCKKNAKYSLPTYISMCICHTHICMKNLARLLRWQSGSSSIESTNIRQCCENRMKKRAHSSMMLANLRRILFEENIIERIVRIAIRLSNLMSVCYE
jgi:hypothetical protein